jgi:hypothetical protein
MTAAAVIIIILVLGIAGKIALDGMFLSAAREFMRSQPDARQAFIAGGGWARFSRRFGLPYAIALIVGGLAWIAVGAELVPDVVPDSDVGVWILFGPSLAMMFLGVVLGVLWAARLVVDL